MAVPMGSSLFSYQAEDLVDIAFCHNERRNKKMLIKGQGRVYPYLEDHPRTCKWLGSPLFTSHEKAIYKGNNPI